MLLPMAIFLHAAPEIRQVGNDLQQAGLLDLFFTNDPDGLYFFLRHPFAHPGVIESEYTGSISQLASLLDLLITNDPHGLYFFWRYPISFIYATEIDRTGITF